MNNTLKSYGKEDDLNLKLVIALARTVSSENRMTQATLKSYGLTLAQFGVLEALYHLGDLKICEIIEKTLSTSGNMTVVISNLERDGFVARYASAEDRRVSYIRLTATGRDVIQTVFPIHVQRLSEQFSTLSHEEKETLFQLLKKLNGK